MPAAHISIELQHGEVRELDVRVASTPQARAAGFQNVCAEGFRGRAILFVYPANTRGQFHMRNVHAGLDIAFADSNGRIFDVQHMLPGTADAQAAAARYQAPRPFRFALEVPAGWFQRHGIRANQARFVWRDLPSAP